MFRETQGRLWMMIREYLGELPRSVLELNTCSERLCMNYNSGDAELSCRKTDA